MAGDWNGWYRLFSKPRYEEEQWNGILLEETLRGREENEPYVMAIDGTPIIRSGLKLPRTAAFRCGIERIQRFVHGAWLTPLEDGYRRAIPIRFLPAFPPKAVVSEAEPCKEWEAGQQVWAWVRKRLDGLELWRELPQQTILITLSSQRHLQTWFLAIAFAD